MNRAIKIHEDDNVVVVIEETKKASQVSYAANGDSVSSITALEDVPTFHKVACKDIPEGAAVIKYGEHIGVAAVNIEKGQHVHTHNVLSVRENLREGDE